MSYLILQTCTFFKESATKEKLHEAVKAVEKESRKMYNVIQYIHRSEECFFCYCSFSSIFLADVKKSSTLPQY